MTTPTKDPQEHLLLDHEYDGIREYDNPLPRWWLWIFYATIVYSVLYLLNVPGIGIGKGRIAAFEADVAAADARAAALGERGPTEGEMLALTQSDSVRRSGAETFSTRCAPCHGPDGGGVIGPNLTDDAWLHGGAPLQIRQTISEGVLAKGMPPWGKILGPDELNAVTAYVYSLRGTTPANPKAPEGVVDSTAGAGAP